MLLLQQKVEFVDVIPRGSVLRTIDGHTVPHLILDYEHSQFFQLFAQLLDVIADNPVVQLHVGLVVEYLQRTIDVDFQRCGNPLCLRFLLAAQAGIQITKHRHILRHRVFKVFLVHQRQAAVNDRFFLRFNPIARSHNQLAQRQDEVRLHTQRVIIIRIVHIDVHRIDIVVAGGRNMDNLSAQRMNQREIFPFRVSDDNIVLRYEKRIGYFPLCREGFAGTGCSENQAVGILQFFAVHHDDVVGQGVQAIVERFAAHEQFLGGERNKNGRGRGGQRPPDRDVVEPQRQAAHQAIFLHIVQPAQRAVILLRNTCHLEHSVIELLPGLGRIQKQHRD